MFYQIAPASGAPKKKDEEESKEEKGKAVPGVVAVLACVLSIGLSGYISLVVTDPDQGKLVSLAEMKVRQEQQAERIANNPHISPRMKKMALSALERSRHVGAAANPSSR